MASATPTGDIDRVIKHYHDAMVEAVRSGLGKAGEPLPGFFRRRSRQVYDERASRTIAESMTPVVREMCEAIAASGAESADSTVTDLRAQVAVLDAVRDDLLDMDRTPRKAVEAVEARLRDTKARLEQEESAGE